ncbi:MAG: glucose 1-dehydrogenase [Chloroflexi bacterium]|nr:glucose 1-dehydrogenase [Chloroflexota bacterium]
MSEGQLSGKVALVTGGGRGIGRAIALRLAREGADIVVAEIDEPLGAGVKAEVEGLGRRCLALACNVASKASVTATVERAAGEFGRLDILVNNAGVHQVRPALTLSEQDWDFVLGVNAKGVLFCCQAAAPYMIKAGSGKIINIASHAGKRGTPYSIHYGASKAAVISLTRGFALELAPHHINVNAVCPGTMDTEMWAQIDENRGAMLGLPKGELMRRTVANIPLGRAGTAEDVAGLVAFLASPDADYMTGQAVNITGGVTMF